MVGFVWWFHYDYVCCPVLGMGWTMLSSQQSLIYGNMWHEAGMKSQESCDSIFNSAHVVCKSFFLQIQYMYTPQYMPVIASRMLPTWCVFKIV